MTCKADNGNYVPTDDATAQAYPDCDCMFLSYGVASYVIYMHVRNTGLISYFSLPLIKSIWTTYTDAI